MDIDMRKILDIVAYMSLGWTIGGFLRWWLDKALGSTSDGGANVNK